MLVIQRDAWDERTDARDGAVVDLMAQPVITREHVRRMRVVAMRRMRRQGFAVEVVAEFFNVSVRTVIRCTGERRATSLAS